MALVEVMQVIRVRLITRGEGTNEDPIRIIDQYWSMGGQFLAEYDPGKPTYAVTGKDFAYRASGGESEDGNAD